MAFELLSWLTGFGLTKLADSFLSPTLEKRFLREIRIWVEEHQLDVAPESLVPQLNDDEVQLYPKLVALRKKLAEPNVPTVEEWHAALVERHQVIGETLSEPRGFFTLPLEDASPLIDKLATKLHALCVQDDVLSKVDSAEKQKRMIELLEEQAAKKPNRLPASHTPMHAEVLRCLTNGLRGAGYRSVGEYLDTDQAESGTIMFVWKMGTRSPNMMLMDVVGGVRVNRISLILQKDSSFRIRLYDSAGQEKNVVSKSFEPEAEVTIFVTWQSGQLNLNFNGEHLASSPFKPFENLGPLTLFGIDVEGTLSADDVMWSVDENNPGLCFRKDGVWHGSTWKQAMCWGRVLDDDEQAILLDDPLAPFRLKSGETSSEEERREPIIVAPGPLSGRVEEMGGLCQDAISMTVNYPHRGILVSAPAMIIAVRWFTEGPVFVIGAVSGVDEDEDRDESKITHVTALLALRLSDVLPGGTINPWMDLRQILQIVVDSFGVPIRCSEKGVAKNFHVEADCDGNVLVDEDESDVVILGGVNRDEGKCRYMWALSVKKYKEWVFKALPNLERGMPSEGTFGYPIYHWHADWSTNSSNYTFPPARRNDMELRVEKRNGQLLVKFVYPDGMETFAHSVGETIGQSVMVMITWSVSEFTLYLNGQLVETRQRK
ncbi:MAG: hypothetical protein IID44_13250 [Planctomycetes bacterium]|nr:hypothetical protein [Planctomycetota bacterium]